MSREILLFNYWEHVKVEKEIARVLPPEHPKRIELNAVINQLAELINNKPH